MSVAAWAAHNAGLARRSAWLNGERFAALHFTGPGTDLTVGLADGHEWHGGASTAKNGITCNPNIPTEEVFTTPHALRVEGHVSSTKPLSHQGTLIDDIQVRFEGGRIVEAKASKGEVVITPPKSKITAPVAKPAALPFPRGADARGADRARQAAAGLQTHPHQ